VSRIAGQPQCHSLRYDRRMWQHVPVHPGTKNRPLLFIAPFDEKDSDLQFQY
jgi:hypothetical protein